MEETNKNDGKELGLKNVDGKEKDAVRLSGTVSYEIIMTEEGYTVDYKPNVKDDLFCLIVSHSIAIASKHSIKEQIKDPQFKLNVKFLEDRLNKAGRTENGLAVLVGDYVQLALHDNEAELAQRKEFVMDTINKLEKEEKLKADGVPVTENNDQSTNNENLESPLKIVSDDQESDSSDTD